MVLFKFDNQLVHTDACVVPECFVFFLIGQMVALEWGTFKLGIYCAGERKCFHQHYMLDPHMGSSHGSIYVLLFFKFHLLLCSVHGGSKHSKI